MALLGWIKRVITDTTGGMEPVEVGLERNPGAVVELGAYNPPDVPLYVLRVGMRSGFGRQAAGLPVYRRENPARHPILKEIYSCEVAGQQLEAANVFSLRAKVQQALEAIAPGRELPLCYFRAPRFDYSLPVYEEGSHLICPVLTGPKIKAHDLASIRGPVIRYLRNGGYLAPGEEGEVQVVRPSDLRLVPPAAVIRSLEDEGVWLPTVEGTSPGGPVIGLLTHPAELQPGRGPAADEAPPSAPDVTALLRLIGLEMARKGRLLSPWALYACVVRPEIWARTEELTDPTDRYLECYMEDGAPLELPIRHTAAGEVVAALDHDGISVFLAGDDDALRGSVGRFLVSAGFLARPDELRTAHRREAPPERLDPSAIWTGEPRSERPAAEELSPASAGSTEIMQPTDQEVTES
jgi:hypothetical protein